MITSSFRGHRSTHSIPIVSGKSIAEPVRMLQSGLQTLGLEQDSFLYIQYTGQPGDWFSTEENVASQGETSFRSTDSRQGLTTAGVIASASNYYSELLPGYFQINSSFTSSSTTQSKAFGLVSEDIAKFRRDNRKLIDLLGKMADGFVVSSFEPDEAISLASLDAAKQFLTSIPEGFPLPKIGPAGDGAISLKWTIAQKTTIMIIEDRVFHLVRNAGAPSAEYFDNVPFRGNVPEELIAELF